MDLTDILTITALILAIPALILNFIALCVIAYQTVLNRRSLDLAKHSIDEDRKIRQIEMLPRAQFIFEVQYHLKKYQKDIEKTTSELVKASNSRDEEILKDISLKALNSPKGLVEKFSYEKGPTWLSEIWLAGAQYYYDFYAPLSSLWSERESRPSWELASSLVDRGKENSYHIKILLTYVDQTVPESYANAPASISNSKFLSE